MEILAKTIFRLINKDLTRYPNKIRLIYDIEYILKLNIIHIIMNNNYKINHNDKIPVNTI